MDNFHSYTKMHQSTNNKKTNMKHTMVNKVTNSQAVTQKEYHKMGKCGIMADRRSRVAKAFTGSIIALHISVLKSLKKINK